jgi:hypothetical protein
MREIEASSSGGIIEFSMAEYKKLVIENPRPYHVVVLYTVDSQCDHCFAMYPEWQTAVYSFKKQESKLPVPTFYGVLYHNVETMS